VAKRHSGLGGRGLSALIQGKEKAEQPMSEWRIEKLPLTHIRVGRFQPRQHFEAQSLQELADSIKAQGLVQPIIVHWVGHEAYEIIAGERRWRAAQIAGMDTIPAIVREVDDQQTLAMALIENIQREALNPLEEAKAYHALMTNFNLNQQEVAEAVGRSRSAVTNMLRLLKLPESVQTWLQDGLLSMGHVRALIALPEAQQFDVGLKAIDNGWSVRQVEQAVQQLQTPVEKVQKAAVDPNIRALENALAESLGAQVKIAHGHKGRGRLEIRYVNLDDLDRILQRLQTDNVPATEF
jgi:ParB family chromosome partitioning protein